MGGGHVFWGREGEGGGASRRNGPLDGGGTRQLACVVGGGRRKGEERRGDVQPVLVVRSSAHVPRRRARREHHGRWRSAVRRERNGESGTAVPTCCGLARRSGGTERWSSIHGDGQAQAHGPVLVPSFRPPLPGAREVKARERAPPPPTRRAAASVSVWILQEPAELTAKGEAGSRYQHRSTHTHAPPSIPTTATTSTDVGSCFHSAPNFQRSSKQPYGGPRPCQHTLPRRLPHRERATRAGAQRRHHPSARQSVRSGRVLLSAGRRNCRVVAG